MNLKLKQLNEARAKAGACGAFKDACVASCHRILAQIKAVKAEIFIESRNALETQDRLIRLALNEAEAVAWQTVYPHLLFPTLAMEKVQALLAWNKHQQSVRPTSPASALAG